MTSFIARITDWFHKIYTIINTPPAHLPPHCSNITALLLHLCDDDRELFRWVLRWIAYPLRNPGAKMSTALVFNGGPASGKSLFFEDVVAALHGQHGVAVGTGQFYLGVPNRWAARARLVVVDAGGYHRGMSTRLRQMITQAHSWVDGQIVPNQMNFVILVNAPGFLPVIATDKHVVVLETPPACSRAFYRAVADEIENGGVDAFRHYLLHELPGMDNFTAATPLPVRSDLDHVRLRSYAT